MTLEGQLIKNRSSLIYRGLGAITFGLVALCYPGEAIHALTVPFGILLILSGLIIIIRSISLLSGRKNKVHLLLGKGIAELLIGAGALLAKGLGIYIFWELIALWIIVTGIFQVATFNRMKYIMEEWKIMVILGNLAVIFGASILANNSLGVIDPTYEIAIFALFFGSCFIYTFFKLKEGRKYLKNKPIELFQYKSKMTYDQSN